MSRRAIAAPLLLVLAGCGSPAVVSPLPSASASATAFGAQPTATAGTSTASLAGCPAVQREAALAVVARLPADPDDITVDHAGDAWVSALAAGTITELSATGRVISTVSDPGGPEGIVQLPDGRFIVADQQANALGTFVAGDSAVTPLQNLVNHTAHAGIDGLAYDAAHQRVLVPDSPNGSLLSYAVGGGTTVLRRGLGRPVAATTDPAGNIYVGMENAPGVLRIAPDGTASPLGSFAEVDEVVFLNGLLYIADLGGTVDAVDPATGLSRTLVSEAPAPQGLAPTAGGGLLLVDETTRVVAALSPCR